MSPPTVRVPSISNTANIESNISILHSNIDTIESIISILHSNIDTIESNISILHSNIDRTESNISILYGNLETLTDDLESNASRTSVLESNIYYTYEDGVDEDDDPITLSGNISTLHTFVESLETDLTSNTERIAVIEGDYVTNADLAIAMASTAAGAGFLTAASVWYTSAAGTTRAVGDFFEELVEVEDESPEFTLNDVVQKPEDWSSYPPPLLGNTTLKKLY